jgi:hypothetical protein
MYIDTFQVAGGGNNNAAVPSNSFFNVMWGKRRDVLKLVVLAGVILLAVSTHWSICHYAKTYLEQLSYNANGDSSSAWQDAAVRIGYPLAVLLLLWILKAAPAR